ncbi:MAG: FtsX-like permease family protein, partial [bacterium]|nr:FtsX-like permease family protein [bacterium]
AGSAVGVLVAIGGLRVLVSRFSQSLPRLDQADLRWEVLAFCGFVTALVAVLTGLAPIWKLRRREVFEVVRWRGSERMKSTFGMAQVALATMLLVSAGLLVRSYLAVESSRLGYKPANLLVFELVNRSYGHGSAPERVAHGARVAAEVRERVRHLPGVTDVAMVGELFPRRNPDWRIFVEGRESFQPGGALGDDLVSANFFSVMGVPLLGGRFFTPEEDLDPSREVAVINEAMAAKYWPGENPIGKRFTPDVPREGRRWRTVVGVVGNMQLKGRENEPIPQMFWAVADYPDPKFVVRSSGEPLGLLKAIRHEVSQVDASAVVYRATTAEQQLAQWLRPRTMHTSLVGLFTVIALLVAGVGIFSLLHYAVTRRAEELGIRMALGAPAGSVVRLVVREGMVVTAVGAVAGVLGSFWLARIFSGLLFGVEPWDPVTIAGSVAVLVGISACSSLAPALRASRVNPAEVLRKDD